MSDSETGEESGAPVARYDEESEVCTGCGSIVDNGKGWCRSCAPEVY